MGETKIDRRRRYTLSVIQEAFFALLAEVGFAKMTVVDICRRAEINRGTFYLHYEDKYALLDALIDEALAAAPPLEGVESATLCQRPPADDDYRLLYSDSDAYARVAQRVKERGAEQMVPWVMEKNRAFTRRRLPALRPQRPGQSGRQPPARLETRPRVRPCPGAAQRLFRRGLTGGIRSSRFR